MKTFLRRFALLSFVAVCFVALQAQQKRADGLHLGSKNVDVYIDGNVYVTSPDGGLSITASGIASGTQALIKAGVIDAGVLRVNGEVTVTGTANLALSKADLVDAGNVNVQGTLGINRAIHCGADIACGTIALSSGTPSTATKTVTAGATCFCWPVGTTAVIAAAGCAANVSSTTATFTGPNTVTTTVGYICFL